MKLPSAWIEFPAVEPVAAVLPKVDDPLVAPALFVEGVTPDWESAWKIAARKPPAPGGAAPAGAPAEPAPEVEPAPSDTASDAVAAPTFWVKGA